MMDEEAFDAFLAQQPDEFFEPSASVITSKPVSQPTPPKPVRPAAAETPQRKRKSEETEKPYGNDPREDGESDEEMEEPVTVVSPFNKPPSAKKPSSSDERKPHITPVSTTEATDPNTLLGQLLSRMAEEEQKNVPIVLDEYQQLAVKAALEGRNIFITGAAGSGKSVLVRHIDNLLTEKGGIVNKVAHNGVAAANVNGMTLHQFLGLGRQTFPPFVVKGLSVEVKDRVTTTGHLIIDEYSTVSNFTMDGLDLYLRQVRGRKYEPFGGMQIIVVGDLAQLKPVDDSKKRNKAEEGLRSQGHNVVHKYKDLYAKLDHELQSLLTDYDSRIDLPIFGKSWVHFKDNIFYLEKAYRQGEDPEFLTILNEVREGYVSESSHRTLLSKVVKKNTALPDDYTMLYSRRDDVTRCNAEKLTSIPAAKGRTFKAVDNCMNDFYKSLLQNIPLLESLELRVGCRVMQKRNISKRLVNGTGGTVIGFTTCMFPDGEVKGLMRPVSGTVFSNPGCIKTRNDIPSIETLEAPPGAEIVHIDPYNSTVYRRDATIHRIKHYSSLIVEAGLLKDTGFMPLPVVLFDNGQYVVSTPSEWSIEINRRVANTEDHQETVPTAASAERLSNILKGKQDNKPKKAKRTRVEKVKLASRLQIPLQVAYAVSIHASQGLTLPRVCIDLGTSIFDDGQAYVALSRGTSLKGIILRDYVRSSIKVDQRVKAFYQGLRSRKQRDELRQKLEEDTRPDDQLTEQELLMRMMARTQGDF